MRSITRDVCALNLSKTWFQAGFGFLVSRRRSANTMGIDHHHTRQASILAMRDVMFV